mmetsp:Transcript_29717/g.70143  ORF Transcript_29717/g.70143 Transcript_29717/m.70143 type:complete len:86 (-) Transcript_29717:1265-1522(-)
MSALHLIGELVPNISGAVQTIEPPSARELRVTTRDSPKSNNLACAVPLKSSIMMLLLFKSPCTMGGLRVCMYKRALHTPIIIWYL